ncbi:hypothetical protein BDP27DRAFT_1328025 [Rhodocollybia butyracea]|uniref:DUF6697 domain-containing protein n=1 Tax=Rhodocollybia butyracea TaxID=206335 RepID=A0A9P5PLK2_9AGAR|nr:hypothetical protein BDP27DRAFT_1328025 [Rhodocollybia butyracea]
MKKEEYPPDESILHDPILNDSFKPLVRPVKPVTSPPKKRFASEPDDAKPKKKIKLEFVGVVISSSSHSSSQTRRIARSLSPGDTESESEDKPKATQVKEEIKPVIKKEALLDPITVTDRINKIGCIPFTVTLDKMLRNTPVSRQFISQVYGGSDTSTFPRISQRNIEKHGRGYWMFWNLEKHPDAPGEPGRPGIWYDADACNLDDDFDKARHCFARISSAHWLYMGDYTSHLAEPLKQSEWLFQKSNFRRYWINAIHTKHWARRSRASIHLRSILRREPTRNEIQAALNEEGKFDHGEKRLEMRVIECVGYDNELQRELVEGFEAWKKSRGARKQSQGKEVGSKKTKGSKKKTETARTKTSPHGKKRKFDDDLEDEVMEDEIISRTGTKSRPRI